MTRSGTLDTRPGAADVVAVTCAWAAWLPLGVMYAAYLAGVAFAAVALTRSHGWQAALRHPVFVASVALCGMLTLSATWTVAPPADAAAHAWHYTRMLGMPLIAAALPVSAARRGIAHYVAASAVVGVLAWIGPAAVVAGIDLQATTLHADGNQRIAASLLLALGAALGLAMALQPSACRARRALWLAAAVLATVGLALQDRRTGMVTLPLLLLVLGLASLRGWRRRLALLAGLLAACALVWNASSGVRDRFAEGVAELQAYRVPDPAAAGAGGEVATSWGMRLRMAEVTLQVVGDAPLLGHGLGSWLTLWQQRVPGGSLLASQRTPHNELLLIATQGGLVAAALWLGVLIAAVIAARRAGRAGIAALLVWVAIAWAGLFNVVLRDAKFALPLLMLAALATAASHRAPNATGRPRSTTSS